MEKIIGRIIEVRGLKVKAKLFSLLPPYLVCNGLRESAPKINGYVKTRIGLDVVICQVVGEYNEEVNGLVREHFLDLQVKGYLSDGKFIQGLRILPIVSANIELLDSEDYNSMFSSKTGSTITIGNDLFDENKKVNVDLNKLMASHIGVFGNTGSGKSNTLTKILCEYYNIIEQKKTKNGKFLVFDLNNEYGENAICSKENKTIYKVSTGRMKSETQIPLDLKSLEEDDFIVLMNASQKTQAPVVKNAYKAMHDEENRKEKTYYINYIKSIINNARRSLFFSMRFHLKEYFTGLDNFQYHTSQGVFYYKENDENIYYPNNPVFKEKLNEIDVKIPDETLDLFLFELYFSVAHENENGINIDYMMPLISRARKLISDFKKVFDFTEEFKDIFQEKNVCVIQLGNVNKDMKEIIPSIVSNNIFRRLAESKEDNGEVKQVINIVVDEAHNILYDDKSDIITHESVLSVFEKIVKEGRKFGLFLMAASQRPSDISETIISQLHNYFIHKLVNPSDISRIRKAVAYMDESALDFITILAPGECIVSGTAYQMPTFLYVSQVSNNNRPASEDVVLVGPNGLFN